VIGLGVTAITLLVAAYFFGHKILSPLLGEYIKQAILLVVALAGALAATHEKLRAPTREKRLVGWVALFALLFTAAVQAYKEHTARHALQVVETFVSEDERTVDEASGAAFVKGRLFVIDDEKPLVFSYNGRKADGRACPDLIYELRPDVKLEPAELREFVDKADDFEAAASWGERLYLCTSHSLNKKGNRDKKRELFLEIGRFAVAADGKAFGDVTRAANLRDWIKAALTKMKADRNGLLDREDELDIEAMAIDENGVAYIGLRQPGFQVGRQRYAIVLKIAVESIFAKPPPSPEIIALQLKRKGTDYAITSLEYDGQTKKLLLLGNTPQKRGFLPAGLWTWHPSVDPIQTAEPVKGWSLELPKEFEACPEALALHDKQGFVFIDAVGYGGQRLFSRADFGLQ